MELKDMIVRRKSVRSFTAQPVEPETIGKIKDFLKTIRPLYPDIRFRGEILPRESVKCFLPWTTPQLMCVYSEEREGFLENVGFVFQQLELYMQSLGLGACWLGMGKMRERQADGADGLRFVIMIAFGYPKGDGQRHSLSEFRRKSLSEISDWADERLEPARLAPSSVNSQPWYFSHEGDLIHAYCTRKGMLKTKFYLDMNRIDMGIALAHLYVSYPERFRFFRSETVPEVKGYGYMGSISL